MKGKRKQELIPATDEGIIKVKWVPFEKAKKKSNKTFRSITEVLDNVITNHNGQQRNLKSSIFEGGWGVWESFLKTLDPKL